MYFEQTRLTDAINLYSGTIATTGAGTALDTTGYAQIVVAVSGTGTINAVIEGSNDSSNWYQILLNDLNSPNPTDTIYDNGGYSFKTSYQYIRYNVLNYTGTNSLSIVGRSQVGPSASDNLTQAFDPNNPLNVKIQNKQDQYGAIMLSDGIPYYLVDQTTYIFNLNGYSAIYLQLGGTGAGTATSSQSIDGTIWSATTFGLVSGSSVSSTPNSVGIWAAPVVGQYLKIVISGVTATQGQCSLVLKQTPINPTIWNSGNQLVNVSQIAGTAVVTGGVAGLTGVGGNIAAGAAPTANPLPTGSVDFGGLTRRLLSDVAGRAIIAAQSPLLVTTQGQGIGPSNTPSSNTAQPHMSVGSLPYSYQLSGALNVQDTSQFEGQSFLELLSQILLELKILNQQMYELPISIAYGQQVSMPPETLRAESSIFAI